MKRGYPGILLALALAMGLASVATATTTATAAAPVPADVPALIPLPVQVQPRPGHFAVDGRTVIVVAPGDAQALFAAHYLAGLLQRTRGLSLAVRAVAHATAGAIVLRRDPQAPVAQPEGYALQVGPQGARVEARSESGVFYGAITLWQLLTADGGRGPVTVADVSIRDWPRFRWRGLMLDSARHFQSVATIEQILDAMARHKLDVFHWHLTDDQGWRIQIKRYPELTRIGAWRTPPGAGTDGEPLRYGGFYTQAQIRQLVAYAAARHITIVPELDMPGHAQAAIASYPWLGVTGQRPPVGLDWGVNPWLYNVNDRTFTFIENVLDEVMALFPSKYIHLGGDEAIKDQWKASPAVRAQMKALGISNYDTLQGWFMGRLGKYLAAHGRQMVGWDEILEGGDVPPGAVVMSWRGTAGAIAAAKAGHDVVLAASGWLYFNNAQTRRTDEPSGPRGILPLAKVYGFEPVAPALTAAQARHVLGVEGALWTEYVITPWQIQHALFPRVDALAEIAWSPKRARNWPSFLQRMPAQMQRYRALGIAAADTPFAADIHLDGGAAQALASGKATLSLRNQVDFGTLRYTTDGRVPTVASPAYTRPFTVSLPTTVRVATFAPAGSELAAPRTRVLDRTALLTRRNGQFLACAGGGLGLRVPLLPDLGAQGTPDYDVDLFHLCWMYPQAPLDTVRGIEVRVARLARNYALAHAQADVVAYPMHHRYGEVEVYEDRCDGPLLASLPLPADQHLGQRFELHGPMRVQHGVHDLCLRIDAPLDTMYGLGRVRLLEH